MFAMVMVSPCFRPAVAVVAVRAMVDVDAQPLVRKPVAVVVAQARVAVA